MNPPHTMTNTHIEPSLPLNAAPTWSTSECSWPISGTKTQPRASGSIGGPDGEATKQNGRQSPFENLVSFGAGS